MMGENKMIYVFLANGFEEIEALGTTDLLKRAGLDACTVSITDDKIVKGSHGISVVADMTINECDPETIPDGVVLPGGMPGAENLSNCERVREYVLAVNGRGGLIAAICAAPMVFGKMGLLKGKKATCYTGFETYLEGAECTKAPTAADGNIITANGAGAFSEFAAQIIEFLKDGQTAQNVLESARFAR